MKTKNLLLAILTIWSVNVISQIILVPDDQPTIQEGINAAENGDTVLVDEGIYYENIRFFGKAITVTSHFLMDGDEGHIDNTIIDGSSATNPDIASTVMFIDSEDTTSIICGFTVRGGSGLTILEDAVKFGGGIACWESGAKIMHCRIMNNDVTHTTFKCGGGGVGSFSETGENWLVIDNCMVILNSLNANAFVAFGGGINVETHSIIRNNTIHNNYCNNNGFKAEGGGLHVTQSSGNSNIAHIFNNSVGENQIESSNAYGAGIAIRFAYATIENNNISDNIIIADNYADGGGIYIEQSSGITHINNNIINGNFLEGQFVWGGGIETYMAGEMLINNNQITNNSCNGERAWGGGISSSTSTGELNINGNEISDNEMNCLDYWFGAGMWIDTYSNIVQIRNNHFANNGGNEVSIWSMGGGVSIYSTTDNNVTIDKNIFTQHSADYGGGLWTFNTFNCLITNNVFSFNDSEIWGGAINFRDSNAKDEISIPAFGLKHNTITNFQKGDAIYYPALINNTFLSNSSGQGGAIHSDHIFFTPVILNSVFYLNESPHGKDIHHSGVTNLVVAYSCIDTTLITTPWTGENNINVDPEIVDDSTHISGSSPCIDAGTISFNYYEQTFLSPDNDIDGQPRPLNSTADIGVDEVLFTSREENHVRNEVTGLQLKSYPNPFRSNTTIEYRLPEPGFVSLKVFDITGNFIETLFSGNQPKGLNKIEWNPDGLNDGQYFIQILNNNHSMVQKVQKLK